MIPAHFPSRKTGPHWLIHSMDPGAALTMWNWKINCRTITRVDDIAAKKLQRFKAPLWRWEKRRGKCKHRRGGEHVSIVTWLDTFPLTCSPSYWIKLHHLFFLLFWITISKTTLILLAPHKRTVCGEKNVLLLQLLCCNLIWGSKNYVLFLCSISPAPSCSLVGHRKLERIPSTLSSIFFWKRMSCLFLLHLWLVTLQLTVALWWRLLFGRAVLSRSVYCTV